MIPPIEVWVLYMVMGLDHTIEAGQYSDELRCRAAGLHQVTYWMKVHGPQTTWRCRKELR